MRFEPVKNWFEANSDLCSQLQEKNDRCHRLSIEFTCNYKIEYWSLLQ